MNKIVLAILFTIVTLTGFGQSPVLQRFKKDLDRHPQPDTARVNKLNELAAYNFLNSNERKKYADEALSIATKLNYIQGRGNAYMLLGTLNNNLGNLPESKEMFAMAENLADKSGDLELQAGVLWRMSAIEKDPQQKEAMLGKADSLSQKIDAPELQANIISSIAAITHDEKQKETLYLQAGAIAKKLNDHELYSRILGQLANFFASVGNEKAMAYFYQSEEEAQLSGNKELLFNIQSVIGENFQQTFTDYARAIEYYLKALHTAESAKDQVMLVNSWTNLGVLYASMNDQTNSLFYLIKAEKANEKIGNSVIESNLQNAIGEGYRLSGKYPEALKSYGAAINATSDSYNIATNESNMADVYASMDSLPLAFNYAFKSLKVFRQFQDVGSISWVDAILSKAYLKKKMADSAIYFAKDGLAKAKETGTIEYMRDNSFALANAYAFKRNFEKAYDNRLLYLNYRDSMLNQDVRNQTAVQQYSFNLGKKESEISALNNQKKYQRNLLLGAIILLILILGTALLLLRNNRLKQKANRLLKRQKNDIDTKAKELSQQKDNIELLSNIGRKITSSLSVEKIISTVYNNVNTLMDANVFGIGIYNSALLRLEFPATYENGKPLPFYSNKIDDINRYGPICFAESKEIIIGDLGDQYDDHLQHLPTVDEADKPASIIFLPLISKEEKLGVITVQSSAKNAFSDYHVFMLRNIAIYTSIALENAKAYETLNETFSTLQSTQRQLIHSEKMASLGELTAGIAHEIQNPLNFVNNFSDLNKELVEEMKENLAAGNVPEAIAIANDIKSNEEKINHHGRRADAIVKGMLQHSRSTTGQREPTDINALADEYLRLSFHGLRAKDKSFNAGMITDLDPGIGKINIIPQDIGRVLLNLFNNAFYAVNEKKKNLKPGEAYDPAVSLMTKKTGARVMISVSDNGDGIPQNIMDKIFQPFFTTKPTGEGTGLGLSLSYDIIKAHDGELQVTTRKDEGSCFTIYLTG